MAVCPFATLKLIPPGSSDPRITPRVAILHVDAANSESLYPYFSGPSNGVESHFFVKRDGEIEQYRDTNWEADANYKANPFAVSIETQGYGEGEWTQAQIKSILRLLRWLHQVHPAIALVKCPAWDGAGIGYHVQFGAPGAWTPVAKSCPGPDRIRQFSTVIIPGLTLKEEDDDMQLNEDIYPSADKEVSVRNLFQRLDRYLAGAFARDKRLREMVAAVKTAVEDNADKAEIKAMLENLDATIQIVVGDE